MTVSFALYCLDELLSSLRTMFQHDLLRGCFLFERLQPPLEKCFRDKGSFEFAQPLLNVKHPEQATALVTQPAAPRTSTASSVVAPASKYSIFVPNVCALSHVACTGFPCVIVGAVRKPALCIHT